jgi:tetratricopeptide (TPR) repeat protein
MGQYADALRKAGRISEAEPVYKDLLDLSRKAFGREHPDALKALRNYIGILCQLDRLDVALPLQEELLELCSNVLGREQEDRSEALNVYAREKALLLMTDTNDSVESLEAPENLLKTFVVTKNCASSLSSIGDEDQAEPLRKRCVDLASRLFGKEHPTTLAAMQEHGSILSKLNRSETLYEARIKMEKVRDLTKKYLGKEDPQALLASSTLSDIMIQQGSFSPLRLAEAAKIKKDVYEIKRKLLGDEHPDVLDAVSGYEAVLARICDLEGGPLDADDLLRLNIISDLDMESFANITETTESATDTTEEGQGKRRALVVILTWPLKKVGSFLDILNEHTPTLSL